MGFTKPQPELFDAWANMRQASAHVEEFVEAVRYPILAAVRDVLGGEESSAAFYTGRGGRPVLSRSAWGKADMPICVPSRGEIRVRVGAFGGRPPARFYMAPHNGRRWVARLSSLPRDGQRAVKFLTERGFREADLHAFLELDDDFLSAPDVEERLVRWTHERMGDIMESGLLAVAPPGGRELKRGDDQEAEGT